MDVLITFQMSLLLLYRIATIAILKMFPQVSDSDRDLGYQKSANRSQGEV